MSCHSELERSLSSWTTGEERGRREGGEREKRGGRVCHCMSSLTLHIPHAPSDENWWRGRTHLGEGLFPASFVSKNLNVDPEPCERVGGGSRRGHHTHHEEGFHYTIWLHHLVHS